MDKILREHYKMNFDEFKTKRVVKEVGEIALDGIKTITKELKKLAIS